MKIYICWTIPDYIGIQIEEVFDSEQKAKDFCNSWNNEQKKIRASYWKVYECDYSEYEVQ